MLPRNLDHARGNVTGNELNPFSREMDGVNARAAVKFEQLLAWAKDLRESPPNGITSCLTNARTAEILDIGLSCGIPVGLCKASRIGTHISSRPKDRTQIVKALSALPVSNGTGENFVSGMSLHCHFLKVFRRSRARLNASGSCPS